MQQSLFGQQFRGRQVSMGAWKDTWNEWKDKYNDTFNPDVPAGTVPVTGMTPAAPSQGSKFLGIPSSWLLWGGVAALGVGAAVAFSSKKGKKAKKK